MHKRACLEQLVQAVALGDVPGAQHCAAELARARVRLRLVGGDPPVVMLLPEEQEEEQELRGAGLQVLPQPLVRCDSLEPGSVPGGGGGYHDDDEEEEEKESPPGAFAEALAPEPAAAVPPVVEPAVPDAGVVAAQQRPDPEGPAEEALSLEKQIQGISHEMEREVMLRLDSYGYFDDEPLATCRTMYRLLWLRRLLTEVTWDTLEVNPFPAWLEAEGWPVAEEEEEEEEEKKEEKVMDPQGLLPNPGHLLQLPRRNEVSENQIFDQMVIWLSQEPAERTTAVPDLDALVRGDFATCLAALDLQIEERRQRSLHNAQAEAESHKLFDAIMEAEFEANVEPNLDEFECPICFCDMERLEGLSLRSCAHSVCLDCVKGAVEAAINNNDYPVCCPYPKCRKEMDQADIKAVAGPELFDRLEQRMMQRMSNVMPNTFRCATPDCNGWCQFDPEILEFGCPLCEKTSCIPCKAQHPGETCYAFQNPVEHNKRKNEIQNLQFLKALIARREAMKCPGCGVVVQKLEGCDWMKCGYCSMELCYATMGPRWGKRGPGDRSGGCGCTLERKCAKDCQNCH